MPAYYAAMVLHDKLNGKEARHILPPSLRSLSRLAEDRISTSQHIYTQHILMNDLVESQSQNPSIYGHIPASLAYF